MCKSGSMKTTVQGYQVDRSKLMLVGEESRWRIDILSLFTPVTSLPSLGTTTCLASQKTAEATPAELFTSNVNPLWMVRLGVGRFERREWGKACAPGRPPLK